MSMTKRTILKIALNSSISVLLIGALFKIQHWPYGNNLMTIGYLISIIYVFIGLFEIYKDEDKSIFEKGGWLIGFLILTPIFGLIYYYTEIRKNEKL